MTDSRVSTRYAGSFLSAVNGKKILDKAAKDAELVINAINSSRDLRVLLSSPVIKKEKKQDVLGKIFEKKIQPDTVNFIKFLAEKGREEILFSVMKSFLSLVDDQLGMTSVEVTSAFELDKDQKDILKKKLEEIIRKTIKFKFSIDKTLLGGFIAKTGDTVYDASVRHQLELLRVQFLKGSSSVSANG